METAGGASRSSAGIPQESRTWLATTLKFTVNEAVAARPGNAAMLGRLTELMFVEIIREYMQQLSPDEQGWLSALRDPHVGKALRLIAERVGYESEPAFNRAFKKATGCPPATWRRTAANAASEQ